MNPRRRRQQKLLVQKLAEESQKQPTLEDSKCLEEIKEEIKELDPSESGVEFEIIVGKEPDPSESGVEFEIEIEPKVEEKLKQKGKKKNV